MELNINVTNVTAAPEAKPQAATNATAQNNGAAAPTATPVEKVVERYIDIDVAEPAEFKSSGDVMFTDTNDIGIKLNDIMYASFADYDGCEIKVVINQQTGAAVIIPFMYFKICDKDVYLDPTKYTAFIPDDINSNGSDIVAQQKKILSFGAPALGRFKTTKSGRLNISKFLLKGKPQDLMGCYKPAVVNGNTVIQINSLDIVSIIKFIYGNTVKDVNGGFYDYQITATRPIGFSSAGFGIQQQISSKWGLCILRLNSINMSNQATQLGYAFSNYGDSGVGSINRMKSE